MAETHDNYKSDAIERMTALGVYKPEFSPAIDRYADMREQYAILTARWKKESYRAYAKTANNDPSKRNPLCVAIESLRKDITTLEAQLCLIPQGLMKIQEEAFSKAKKSSKLATALNELKSG